MNRAFIPQNQHYYNSPLITNPPTTIYPSSNSNIYNPYTHYTNYAFNPYSNCYNTPYANSSNQGFGNYAVSDFHNNTYGYGSGGHYGCGCQTPKGFANYEYGYGIIKERLTPKFPQKLGHSFVTSGERVEDKLVINQPTVESAPLQTQHRKTYVPYTRKYIQYQDYIQYIPVQRSEWQYKKVMKQIDFVPQEYYESSYEYLPREKVQHKVRYLPVEQQVVHVPQETIDRRQRQLNNQQQHARQFPQQIITHSPRSGFPVKINLQNQRQVIQGIQNRQNISNPIIDLNRQRQLIRSQQANRQQTIIHPAESTVQMVPDSWFRRQQPRQQSIGVMDNRRYNFPQTGGVVIGSSFQSHGKMYQHTEANPKSSHDNQPIILSQPIQNPFNENERLREKEYFSGNHQNEMVVNGGIY